MSPKSTFVDGLVRKTWSTRLPTAQSPRRLRRYPSAGLSYQSATGHQSPHQRSRGKTIVSVLSVTIIMLEPLRTPVRTRVALSGRESPSILHGTMDMHLGEPRLQNNACCIPCGVHCHLLLLASLRDFRPWAAVSCCTSFAIEGILDL